MKRITCRKSLLGLVFIQLMMLSSMGIAESAAVNSDPAAYDKALKDEIATIKSRYRAYFLKPDYPDAESVQKTQKADGSWADVDYDNRDVAAWAPAKHIDRVKRMAAVYAKPGNPFYHSPVMLAGVEKGLQFWYARKPKSDNWWHNNIGQQLQLERILVLLEHDLPPDLMQMGLTYFQDLSKPTKATGENLVWYAGEYMTHGLLTGNETEIRGAIQIIEDTIVITDKEGIQVDYAFHQHGPQLYNGGYGLGFLQDSAMWASYVAGTRFAFTQDKIDLLSAYLLDGCRWMMRGPMFDYGANGRGLVRKVSPPPKGMQARDEYFDQLALLNPSHKAEFTTLKAATRGEGHSWTVLGNKQFWSSDFMTNQTKAFYTSVKMNSSRTVGIETINGENPKGYWLPFGLTYIAQTGNEYFNIFPVWDWAHLPGVTSPTVVYELKNNFKQPNTFVGGVSDGMHGACAMKLDIESPGESLHAHKAWFFFGNEFVALGSGISSTLGDPVDTTLNQTLLKGPVVIDGKAVAEGRHELKAVSWVLHDGIGYLFPVKTDAVINNAPQTGDWNSISTSVPSEPVSEKVFSLCVNHGVKPTDGNYAYVVVADADKAKLADMAANPKLKILSNTSDLQAVRNDATGISEAIFYRPGSVSLKTGWSLSVDQPCMILAKDMKDGINVTLASPMSGQDVSVNVLNPAMHGAAAVFSLPSGPMEGSSQSRDIKP